MAGDNRSRRLVKFWWVLAFVLGAVLGTIVGSLLGLRNTIVMVASVGVIAAVAVATVELGLEPPQRVVRSIVPAWRKPLHPLSTGTAAKPPKGKAEARRGQLHAISGRKIADPPSHRS
ncbi:MAG: hypothetical protein ACREQN_00095 [Candidatus Binataceae bacterium]